MKGVVMNNYEKEIKQERSIPVQGRIDLIELAELDRYFMSKGQEIRTMSQLLSWGVSLLVEVLNNNDVLGDEFETLTDASNYMRMRGLYQRGIMKRGKKKLGMSMGFESLRLEGIDPKGYAPGHYKNMHNENSIEPYDREISDREVDAAKKMIARARANKEKMNNYDPIQAAKDSGMKVVGNNEGGIKKGMSNEELNAYDVERERKVREMENAPVDVSMFNVVKE